MLNQVLLIGRLTADPVLKALPSGKRVATFTLAVNNPAKDANGNRYPADFIDCVVYVDKLVTLLDLYVRKGQQIFVEGRLRIRSYKDKKGLLHRVPEVIVSSIELLGSKQNSSVQSASSEKTSSYDPYSDPDVEEIINEIEKTLGEDESLTDDGNFEVPF